MVTNTVLMVTATSVLRDGVAVRKQAGEIADCRPGKPRSMAAGPTARYANPTRVIARSRIDTIKPQSRLLL